MAGLPDDPTYYTLLAEAVQAVTNNEGWLTQAAGVTYPLTTAEQTSLVNQVVALTHQVDVLIKFAAGLLSDTGGT